MSGFAWRWPLALVAGVVLIACVIFLILYVTTRTKITPDITVPTAEEKPKAARSRTRLLAWGLKDNLDSAPLAARYRSYRLAAGAAVSLICAGLLASLGLLARPSSVDESASRASSRDIVLCLDVSGSALPFDREVIATYLELVKSFKTERIGMSIFNSTSRTVFPLTDDYSVVTEQLTSAMTALAGVQTQDDIDNMSDKQYQAISDWLAGTQNRKDATSLIGDGLINCAAMLPRFSVTGEKVSRQSPASIVFASDNVLSGSPLYTLQQALDIATANSVHVDALFTGAQESESDATTVDMKQRVEASGGTFMARSNTDSVDNLVRSIENLKTQRAQSESNADVSDNPAPWIVVLMALMGIFFLVTGWVRR